MNCGCFRSRLRTISALFIAQKRNSWNDNQLRHGGGGNRTPVPRQRQRCLYVHSRLFVLAAPSANRQALAAASPTVFSPRRGQASFRSQPTSGASRNSGRLPRDGLPVFRQPWHKSCHVKFSPGVLRGLLTTSARHILLYLPGRIRSPPKQSLRASERKVCRPKPAGRIIAIPSADSTGSSDN